MIPDEEGCLFSTATVPTAATAPPPPTSSLGGQKGEEIFENSCRSVMDFGMGRGSFDQNTKFVLLFSAIVLYCGFQIFVPNTKMTYSEKKKIRS
jgi:hypothetical protein